MNETLYIKLDMEKRDPDFEGVTTTEHKKARIKYICAELERCLWHSDECLDAIVITPINSGGRLL